MRVVYAGLGVFATLLGIIGAVLPVMPTTCFLLLALWFFSKSSTRLHRWLWEHKRFGAGLQRWQEHRCIPIEAKIAATLSMTGSMLYMVLFSGAPTLWIVGAGVIVALGAFYVLRAPSRPPTAVKGRCPLRGAEDNASVTEASPEQP